MRVGFVGLGVMGLPMAGHLLRAGHDVAVWARRPEATADIAAAGAAVCATPAELAARSEVVISIITASADVENLALGPDGLIGGFAPGGIHVDMSTIAPATARKLAAAYAERGIGWLDAPVSGGEVGARDATLAIMAGGEAAVLDKVRPLFDCLGKTVVHIGEAGAGQVAKACNQMIMVNVIQASAEAMRLAGAHGLDATKVIAAQGRAAGIARDLISGSMRSIASWFLVTYQPLVGCMLAGAICSVSITLQECPIRHFSQPVFNM